MKVQRVLSAAPSAVSRTWIVRGVPTPKSVRIHSPRLQALA